MTDLIPTPVPPNTLLRSARRHLATSLAGLGSICVMACSSSSSSGSTDAGACGLALYGHDYDKSCQGALDASCCNEERACGADPACAQLVACFNACPTPRQGACLSACAGGSRMPPGVAHLDAIAACTSGPGYSYPPGVTCPWPQGDGH